MTALDVYRHSLNGSPPPTNQDLITQLRTCLLEVIYNDCSDEIRNPATIATTERTFEQVKEDIIKYEKNLKEGELDRKKVQSGIDPNSKEVPDYGFKKPDSHKKTRDSGDVTKAYLTAKNTPQIKKKRPSGGSSGGSRGSSKRGRYFSSKISGYKSSTSHRERSGSLTRDPRLDKYKAVGSRICGNCGKHHEGQCPAPANTCTYCKRRWHTENTASPRCEILRNLLKPGTKHLQKLKAKPL
jgi:hypothetical protein